MPASTFLNHPGEMAARICEYDWSGHPLGPPEHWDAELKVAVDICLGSSFPTAIYWGPDLYLLYNDAWSHIPEDRHPWALGQRGATVWADIWHVVGPHFQHALEGQATSTYDQQLPIVRGGEVRETYWNYSVSPIRGSDGTVRGVFNQGNETTRQVIGERTRLAETGRLRELFLQAPGAVALLHGPDFVFEMINDAYGELIGHRDVIGQRIVDALPEVIDQGFVTLLDNVYRSGETYNATSAPVYLIRKEGGVGEIRLLDFVYQPIRDAAGDVTDIFVVATDVTDRARAEAALRESEERLELALDSSVGIGTWDWDIVNDRVTADARFARLYGVDPELARQGAEIDRFFTAIHPDDLPRVQAAIEAALTEHVEFNEEYRLVQPDGSVRWVTAQGSVRLDQDGRAVRFPGVSFDITSRHEAEEVARVAAADLRIANEAQAFVFRLAERLRALDSPAAITRLTATALGRRLGADRVGFYRVLSPSLIQFGACWTSERLATLTGTSALADLGTSNFAAYRVGDTRVVDDFTADSLSADTPASDYAAAGIGVPLRRQGQWAATMYIHQALPRHWTADEVSLVEAVAEIAWDAVDRAVAVSGLRESEEKFRAIANSIDQMVWSALPDGFHDYYNERWYEFTGVPRGSTDGAAWAGVFHPDDQPRAWEAWTHSLATGEPYRIEYRLRHRSGEYRWVLGSAQPVLGDDGRITRWFGTCTDIEEIVEARDVLARSRRDLEAAIAERTQQLMAAEEQLRQAQKMEAVGQLTGGIAHDFNNMLAVVIGALDLLERRIAQGRTDVTRYVDAARDGATRAAALTQRLLAFARQTPLTPAAVDLNMMIAEMTDLLSRTIGDSVMVETRLEPGLWHAVADPSQLENVILNLSVNARDAMPRGGTLTIVTANRPIDAARARALGVSAGDFIEIAVSDTGEGMTQEVASKAFDPFFTTKSVGKGTGLGLSQVFGFVRQSGGHVALDSAPGAGTTVRMLLPRAEASAVPTPSISASDPAGGTETVLVVEDDDRVRTYSVEALRELGYTVIHAHDGPTALAMIDAGQRAHLLFTDMIMPEMTGSELADAARVRMPELRVLFTSGYTRDAIEQDGPIAGTILTKPFDMASLARRVRATLDG